MHAQYIFALQNISWKYENKDMTEQEKALFVNFYRISKFNELWFRPVIIDYEPILVTKTCFKRFLKRYLFIYVSY